MGEIQRELGMPEAESAPPWAGRLTAAGSGALFALVGETPAGLLSTSSRPDRPGRASSAPPRLR